MTNQRINESTNRRISESANQRISESNEAGNVYMKAVIAAWSRIETVLKLIFPLLGYALLPCHSERSAAESKNLLSTQVEQMLRLRSARQNAGHP